MRWSPALTWTTVAAFVAALLCQFLGWEVARSVILIVWVALVLAMAMSRGMRWTGVLTYWSAVALLGAVIVQLAGWPYVRGWFLLAWAALLLPVAIALFSHPMRVPAWGLFAGFWGVIGVLWLIVLQGFAVSGELSGDAYSEWAAWPLAIVGIWLIVASSLGFGAERFPRGVDALGLLAGAGLLAISVTTWTGAQGATSAVGVFATIAYGLWAVGFGWVLWGSQDVSHRFRGLSPEHAT
ncbi:MAG TPA: hypothetical protein VIO37_10065 [Candidatus Dormibacteraeota bacterium]